MLERRYWPELDAENQAELLAYLGTAACAKSYFSPTLSWAITGVDSNDYNGVIWTRLSAAEADQRIPSLVEQFREQNIPALWHLDSASQPLDIAQRLVDAGCRLLLPGVYMVAQLNHLSFELPQVAALSIEQVTTATDARLDRRMDTRR